MKKSVLLLAFSTIFYLIACSENSHINSKNNIIASLFSSSISSKSESEIIESSSQEQISQTSSISESYSSNNEMNYPVYNKIDIDLTTMNATLVYSQVLNMLNEPNEYINKIVKMKGLFVPYESTNPDYCYPAIMIKDATACCANGIEFLLYGVKRCSMEGGHGYPLYNEEATIVGRFETYLEGTYLFVHLVDAIWLEGID